jgi:hypothetical protein
MKRFKPLPKPLPVCLLLGLTLCSAGNAVAAVPVEREVERQYSVQVRGGPPRPIGAIDFSSTGGASRRMGPWDLEMDGAQDREGVIFYDDGSFEAAGEEVRYRRHPDAGRTCTTHGNVTVCK